jgi:alkanesulfonate monooxygenase SsuD/methylene tetrahydromethanopterin reductase-like flavin-dependent oxidoreductase (luciferase family)
MAKEIASLQFLSGGRFELGVGAGWDAHEFEVAGVKLARARPPHRRDPRNFRETVDGRAGESQAPLLCLRRGRDRPAAAGTAEILGRRRRADAHLALARSRDDRADSPRICRKADGWLSRASGSNRTVIEDWTAITRRLDEIGRARDSLVFGHLNFIHVVPTDDEAAAFHEQQPAFQRVMGRHRSFEHLANSYFLGTPRHMRERIEELAAAGLRYLVLAPVVYDIGQLDLIESEVVRNFRTP